MDKSVSTAHDTSKADHVLRKVSDEARRIKGIYAPTLTAFGEDGSVNLDGVRQFVRFLLEQGVHGLTPLGSAGEPLGLSTEEKKQPWRSLSMKLPVASRSMRE